MRLSDNPTHESSHTLVFLDIDGVMRPFSSLPDHWRQIFLRNFWTKIGRYDLIMTLIDEEKKALLRKFIEQIGGEVKVVISSDWRKTVPINILSGAIGQDIVGVTPFTQRNIANPIHWKQWYHEATHKKELRIQQIEAFVARYNGIIKRIIVIDDSSVVPHGYKIGDIAVEFIQPESSVGIVDSNFIPN